MPAAQTMQQLNTSRDFHLVAWSVKHRQQASSAEQPQAANGKNATAGAGYYACHADRRLCSAAGRPPALVRRRCAPWQANVEFAAPDRTSLDDTD